jgi:UDP-N-acetylglucosamine acyltransferase
MGGALTETKIHPSAVIEDGAQIGPGSVIGPFCHIGPGVEIGACCALRAHVVIAGRTRIGQGVRIFPFASLGAPSQDIKANLAEGALTVGDGCVIREGVTINAGVGSGTRLGPGCVLLAAAHVAHDCILGAAVILSNQTLLGGHVVLGDHVVIGGATAVHQHVRIGDHAFVGGLAGVEGDVIPFGLAGGNRARLFGLNRIGLRRRGFAPDRIARLSLAYRELFGAGSMEPLRLRIDAIAGTSGDDPDVATLLDFLRAPTSRPLCAPHARGETA